MVDKGEYRGLSGAGRDCGFTPRPLFLFLVARYAVDCVSLVAHLDNDSATGVGDEFFMVNLIGSE
jgi:hypothetical protein